MDITKPSCHTSRPLGDRRHRLPAGLGVAFGQRSGLQEKEAEMYGSMGQDLARAQMQDRMREAEAYRLTKDTRGARASAHRVTARRVVRTALTSLLWPVKH
jgi:hypothetical protein